MFDTWTDEQFAAWLAGFVDGEGSIDVPTVGVEMTIANTNRGVIEAIQGRLDAGIITETTFSNPAWQTKYTLRLRNYPHAARVLRLIRPYLVLKADAADIALAKAEAKIAEREKVRQRNIEVIRLVAEGTPKGDIAKRFGIGVSRVNQIVHDGLEGLADPQQPWKRIPPGIRRARERHFKEKTAVQTVTRRIAAHH